MDLEHERRKPGRPRAAGANEAIMAAVIDVLTDVGFRGLTIDAVAQRAGVGKATIYRRWAGKEQLVLDALARDHTAMPHVETPDLRQDLLAYYLPLAEADAQRGAVRLMPALAAEAALDAEIAERLRAYVSVRRSPVAAMLERARGRGEIGNVDIELAIDLLTGPIMYRLYFSGGVVDEPFIRELIDRVLAGITGVV